MNYSASRSDYKVVKGITTEVHFFIKNTDRDPVTLAAGETLEIVITDFKRTRTLLTKTLVLVDPVRSIWKLALSKEEVADWPIAALSYSLVVNRIGADQVMLYLDRGYGGYSELQVIAGPYPEPRGPEEFIPADFVSRDGSLYSGAIPASTNDIFLPTVFTAAFYSQEFLGRVTIQATLDEQPDAADEMWFDVSHFEAVSESNGVIGLNAYGSFSWLRFVVRADDGEITKIALQR